MKYSIIQEQISLVIALEQAAGGMSEVDHRPFAHKLVARVVEEATPEAMVDPTQAHTIAAVLDGMPFKLKIGGAVQALTEKLMEDLYLHPYGSLNNRVYRNSTICPIDIFTPLLLLPKKPEVQKLAATVDFFERLFKLQAAAGVSAGVSLATPKQSELELSEERGVITVTDYNGHPYFFSSLSQLVEDFYNSEVPEFCGSPKGALYLYEELAEGTPDATS